MAVKIGSAPDSWGVWFAHDPRQVPWQRFLDEVAQAGYAFVELGPFGYLPADAAVIGRELDRRRLVPTGSFVMGDFADPTAWPEIERQLHGWGPVLRELGAGHLVLIDAMYTDLHSGARLAEPELDDAGFARLVAAVERARRTAWDGYGLTALFHPHAQTHVESEVQIERLLAAAPQLPLCFDTGHHAYCGGEPVGFMRRWHRRIPYLHLKSVDGPLRDHVLATGMPFAAAVAEGVFVEPARGIVDFAAFGDLLREIGFDGHAIVEQDMYPVTPDRPLPIAMRTRQFLAKIGIG